MEETGHADDPGRGFCVGGIGLFVTVAAVTTTVPIRDTRLMIVVAVLTVVLVIFAALFAFLHRKLTTLSCIVAAGVQCFIRVGIMTQAEPGLDYPGFVDVLLTRALGRRWIPWGSGWAWISGCGVPCRG